MSETGGSGENEALILGVGLLDVHFWAHSSLPITPLSTSLRAEHDHLSRVGNGESLAEWKAKAEQVPVLMPPGACILLYKDYEPLTVVVQLPFPRGGWGSCLARSADAHSPFAVCSLDCWSRRSTASTGLEHPCDLTDTVCI